MWPIPESNQRKVPTHESIISRKSKHKSERPALLTNRLYETWIEVTTGNSKIIFLYC
jgi:hypothetical protein